MRGVRWWDDTHPIRMPITMPHVWPVAVELSFPPPPPPPPPPAEGVKAAGDQRHSCPPKEGPLNPGPKFSFQT